MEKEDMDILLKQYANTGEFGQKDMRKKYPHVDFDKLMADAEVIQRNQRAKIIEDTKEPQALVESNPPPSGGELPLQKLIGSMYSVLMEITLWLIPIIGAIIGGAVLEMGFGGVILGIIAGLLLDVVLFGPVVIMMNIRSSLKKIENK